MREFLAVAIGGMIGSVARYAVNLFVTRFGGILQWPLATLIVNVAGCFAVGWFAAAARRGHWLDTPWELAVRVGFLGGLTTFSSFGLEVVRLYQEGRTVTAGIVIGLNVIFGLLAVALGEACFAQLFSASHHE